MTLGAAETEATPNTGIEDKPNDIGVDREITEGEKVAQVYYRHRRRVARRVYRRRYRRTRRVARRVYRHRRRVYRRVRRRVY